MIVAEHLSKRFGEHQVLDDVSVRFERGKTNLIIGTSGSGKTVLMKCLVGLIKPDKGTIEYDGRPFSESAPQVIGEIRREIGMLFQGSALFDSMTVEENVIFPLSMFTKLSQDEKLERANFCLQRVNLENANKLYPSELSGGMKKRVAIARAISINPKYLFCDEPNSGLDPVTSNVIDKLISEITREYKITTVVNTHDMNSVMEIGDKVCFIFQGRLWWEGTREYIFNSDNKELNNFVFASQLTKQLKH
ncbi:MAG: ATP-binding cassette domain-containing protein [Bacteroidales bacterium]|jgi:phospholipid/cholesterol/gamma-HCH transport system ATP-binding protein|nr:ATP-binding cassette domain-containing protein [Bacteroidales bacterium]